MCSFRRWQTDHWECSFDFVGRRTSLSGRGGGDVCILNGTGDGYGTTCGGNKGHDATRMIGCSLLPCSLAVCRGHTIKSGVCTRRQQARRASAGWLRILCDTPTRSWLDAVGTPVEVQQKLMRHADIRTTMNVYGDVVTDEMAVANSKVSRLALSGNGLQNGLQAS
jgi:hypothetical protein